VDWSSGNITYANNFSAGLRAPYDIGENRWDENGLGNFWSDYSEVDGNRDGLGDVAHLIPLHGADRFPLMSPVDVSKVTPSVPAEVPTDAGTIIRQVMHVTGEETIEGRTLVLDAGEIKVRPGGKLIIRDSTLVLGAREAVDIDVRGGTLQIEHSVIKAAEGGFGFQIIVAEGAELIMIDSELHDASWAIGNGLFVERARNVIIERNLITGSHTGMYMGRTGSARIVGNTLRGNGEGMLIDTTSNLLIADNVVDGAV